MSTNKLVQSEKQVNKNNRRKHTIIGCLTAFILSFVLVVGGLFGTLYFLYEKHAKPITLMSFGEAVSFTFGLYGANDKKIVTNPYDQLVDSERFFKGLSDSLHIDKILKIEDLITGFNSIEKGEGFTPPSEGGSTGNSFFDTLLQDAHFDFSNLKDYDDSSYPGFMISDKMLAAVMQDTLDIAEEIPEFKKIQEDLGFNLDEVVGIKQVKVNVNESNNTNSTLTLTIGANTKTLAEKMLAKTNMKSTLISLIKGMLPRTIYFSCTVTPMKNSAPSIQINTIGKDLMKKAVIAIDNIMKMVDSDQSFTGILNLVGSTLYDVFTKVQTLAGEGGVEFGNYNDKNGLAVDTLQIIMKSMGVKNVSTNEFLLMIKHLHSYDLSGETLEDFINRLENYSTLNDFNNSRDNLFATYGISAVDAKDFTPTNFIDKANELPKYINIVDGKIDDKHLYNYTNAELKSKSVFSDKGLAQIFDANINKILTENNNNLKMKVLSLSLKDDYMEIVGYIDIKTIMSTHIPDSPLKPLIMSLFPNQLYANINAPYERKSNGEISSNIIFNYSKDEGDNSQQLSDNMLKTLNNIMKAVSPDSNISLDKNELLKQLDESLYKTLDQLYKLEVEQGIKIEFAVGKLIMPTCYELISSKTKRESDSSIMPANEVQLALQDMYAIDSYLTNGVPTYKLEGITLDRFVSEELENKMYFNQGIFTPDNVYNQMVNLQNIINNTTFPFQKDRLVNNNTPLSDIDNFYMQSKEFGVYISQGNITTELDKLIDYYNESKIVDSYINSNNKLVLTTCSILSKTTINNDYDLDMNKVAPKYLFINVYIDLNDINSTTIQLNSTKNDNDTARVLELMSRIGKADNISLDSIKNTIVKELNTSMSKLESNGITLTATNSESRNGIIGTNIYNIIASQLNGYEKNSGKDELLRSTLYGLNNFNNFIAESNIPTTEPSPTIDIGNSSVTISDTFIGYKISEKHTIDRPRIVKSALLEKNSENAINYFKQFNVNQLDKDILATTFEIEKSNFGLVNDSLAFNLIPDKLYISIFMNISNSDDYIYNINDLDIDNITYLKEITTAGDNANSVDQSIEKAVQEIKGLTFNISGINIKFSDLMSTNSTVSSVNDVANSYGNITAKYQIV